MQEQQSIKCLDAVFPDFSGKLTEYANSLGITDNICLENCVNEILKCSKNIDNILKKYLIKPRCKCYGCKEEALKDNIFCQKHCIQLTSTTNPLRRCFKCHRYVDIQNYHGKNILCPNCRKNNNPTKITSKQ